MLVGEQSDNIQERAAHKALQIGKEISDYRVTTALKIKEDIIKSLINEFGVLSDDALAEIYEFIDQYELPYRLQKEFGLIKSSTEKITVLEAVRKQDAGTAEWWGVEFLERILTFKSKRRLMRYLHSATGMLEFVDVRTDKNSIIFIAGKDTVL